jgi:hypothetical protein
MGTLITMLFSQDISVWFDLNRIVILLSITTSNSLLEKITLPMVQELKSHDDARTAVCHLRISKRDPPSGIPVGFSGAP